MDQLAFDRALEREIADRLATGEDVVTRLITMRWFTFYLEGEDIVVGDEMQRSIEQMAGAQLIEYTPVEYPMTVALGFDPKVRSAVRERLAQQPKPTHPVTLGPLDPGSIAP